MRFIKTAFVAGAAFLCVFSCRASFAANAASVIQEIKESIPANPEAAEARRLYIEGNVKFLEHDFEGAAEHYLKSLEIEPLNAETRFALANSFFEAGRVTEAMREWRSVLKYDPQFVEARVKMAGVYRTRGDVERAMDQYVKVLNARPDDFGALVAIASLYRENSNLKEAEAALIRAVELDPNSAEATDMLGLVYLDRKFTKSATLKFKKAIELAPDRADFHDHLGRAYERRAKDSDDNVKLLTDKIRKASGDKTELKKKLEVSKNNAKIFREKAIASWTQSIRLDETNPMVRTLFADSLRGMGRFDEALEQYNRASQLAPSDPQALIRVGDALLQKGQPIDAIYRYEKALAIDPACYDAYYQMGLAYKAKNLVPEATQALETYIASAPKTEKDKKTRAQQIIRMMNFVPPES